jgi:hypothetical protein
MAKELSEKKFFNYMRMRDHGQKVETRFGGTTADSRGNLTDTLEEVSFVAVREDDEGDV